MSPHFTHLYKKLRPLAGVLQVGHLSRAISLSAYLRLKLLQVEIGMLIGEEHQRITFS